MPFGERISHCASSLSIIRCAYHHDDGFEDDGRFFSRYSSSFRLGEKGGRSKSLSRAKGRGRIDAFRVCVKAAKEEDDDANDGLRRRRNRTNKTDDYDEETDGKQQTEDDCDER